MKVGIIGCGRVGFVYGNYLCKYGNSINFYDKNYLLIENLRKQKTPFFENDLEDLFNANYKKFGFFTNLNNINDCDCVIIAVDAETIDGTVNLVNLHTVINSLIKLINKKMFVIIKSTILPGTTRYFSDLCKQHNNNISLLFSPEFMTEGRALYDFENPFRKIYGTENSNVDINEIINFETQKGEVIVTDYETAELIKYGSNCFLANKLTFFNKMSELSNVIGADNNVVLRGMCLDERIGKYNGNFINGNLGFGGGCLLKDLQALEGFCKSKNYNFSLLSSILKQNEEHIDFCITKVVKYIPKNKKILLCGISFKENTDDIRNSKGLELAKKLMLLGYNVTMHNPIKINLDYPIIYGNINEIFLDYEVIIFTTPSNSYKMLDLSKSKKLKFLFDFTNIFIKKEVERLNIKYENI